MNDEVEAPAEKPETAADKPKKTRDPVKRATLVVLVVIALLLAWYLRADRVTPYTSQARVNALVVPVASDVAGRVTKVFVGNNQWVNAGDPLFEVDIENYRLAVETAQANYQAAQQAVGAAEAAVEAANAGVAAAVANLDKAQKDYDRTRAIHDQDSGAISMRRVELEEASLAIARSQLDAAKAQREQAIQNLGDDGERNVRILQARAALDQAQLNLSRATTKAPSDGVVTDVRLDVGNFAGAGAPQMTFVSTENIWLEAEFTENNLGHLDPGDPVGIVFDAIPGRVIKGKVREVGYGVAVNKAPLGQLPTIRNDPNWLREAQRYAVLVDFERPADLDPMPLKVGSQASLVVYTGQHPVTNALGAFVIRMVSWLTYAY